MNGLCHIWDVAEVSDVLHAVLACLTRLYGMSGQHTKTLPASMQQMLLHGPDINRNETVLLTIMAR